MACKCTLSILIKWEMQWGMWGILLKGQQHASFCFTTSTYFPNTLITYKYGWVFGKNRNELPNTEIIEIPNKLKNHNRIVNRIKFGYFTEPNFLFRLKPNTEIKNRNFIILHKNHKNKGENSQKYCSATTTASGLHCSSAAHWCLFTMIRKTLPMCLFTMIRKTLPIGGPPHLAPIAPLIWHRLK